MSNKKIYPLSIDDQIKKARKTGNLDLSVPYLFYIYDYYLDFTNNSKYYVKHHKLLLENIAKLKYKYSNFICTNKTVLPDVYNKDGSDFNLPKSLNPTGISFETSNITTAPIFAGGPLTNLYEFNLIDFESHYNDSNDQQIYGILIDRSNLDEGGLRRANLNGTYTTFGENANSIIIVRDQMMNWAYYSNSYNKFSHDISFKFIDQDINNNLLYSNDVTLTINRPIEQNQPATIGDITLKAANRFTTVFTVAHFTTQLSPPYNDPEGDLIDAVKIIEISTANKGKFKLFGNEIVEDQIILKVDIESGAFIHEGANSNDVETDSINFQVRDRGSLIWVG